MHKVLHTTRTPHAMGKLGIRKVVRERIAIGPQGSRIRRQVSGGYGYSSLVSASRRTCLKR